MCCIFGPKDKMELIIIKNVHTESILEILEMHKLVGMHNHKHFERKSASQKAPKTQTQI